MTHLIHHLLHRLLVVLVLLLDPLLVPVDPLDHLVEEDTMEEVINISLESAPYTLVEYDP